MASKIVDAIDLGAQGITVTVDLDADNPEPPAEGDGRVFTVTWGSYESSANPGETRAQYRNRIRDETRALARERAKARGAKAPVRVDALIGVDIS